MNLSLLINFTKQELVDRYSGSLLGGLWTFVFPIVNILIFTFVFSQLMGTRLPNSSSEYGYSVYLISGIIAWTAFANTITRSANVFFEKSHIIKKIKVLLPHLPLYIVLAETVVFVISLFFFFFFLAVIGYPLSRILVLIPFVYILQQIFAYAIGFFFAIFNVFLKDVKEFANVLLQVWFWLTPIVYTPDVLSEAVKVWLDYNPAYIFVQAYHDILVFGNFPNTNKLIILVIAAHIMLMAAYLIFKKLEKDIRDFI